MFKDLGKGIIFGGSAGILRGVIEGFRLHSTYPCAHGPDSLLRLSIQSTILYLVVGVFIGLFAAFLAKSLKYKLRGMLLIIATIAFILDVTGCIWPVMPSTLVSKQHPSQESLKSPDLLLITLDTCRSDHLSSYGYMNANLPNLNRLAGAGTQFTNMISPIPITTSSHATILTGKYPVEHGSRFNAVPIRKSVETLAGTLADHGYATGAFVSAFPVAASISGLNKGFCLYDQLFTPSLGEPLIYRSTLLKPLSGWGPFRPSERTGIQTIKSTLSWWKKLDLTQSKLKQPRFTWVHLYDPHLPYEPPEQFRQYYDSNPIPPDSSIMKIHSMNHGGFRPDPGESARLIAAYDGEIMHVDRLLGILLDQLEKTGKLQNTLIIVTADHGESLTEHNYYFSHGDDVFDPSIQVPGIIVLPGKIPCGKLISDPTMTTDLMPTILDVMGIPFTGELPFARNLMQTIHGENLPDTPVFGESGAGVYIHAHDPSDERVKGKLRFARTSTRKLIVNAEGVVSEYNLDNDPGELKVYNDLDNDFDSLFKDLVDFMEETEQTQHIPEPLLDPDTIEQLERLGYIHQL